jgi:hypothetical protein
MFQNSLAEQVLDLAIYAPQFILSPPLQTDPQFFIDAQEKSLPFTHVSSSRVQSSRVDHRMHFTVSTENNHQIADHCGTTFIIEMNHIL